MTQQHENLNTEPSIPASAVVPQTDAIKKTGNLKRQTRSVVDENPADRKRGSGGLDSLGGGRLP